MSDLLKIILNGTSTWPARDAAFFLLLVFNALIIWRIATNHLAHIEKDIHSIKDDVGKIKERVAHLEGKIET